MKNKIIDKKYLIDNPLHLFVFGDNNIRKGLAGSAKLRYMKNSYGFITKKYPSNQDSSFYRPEEYISIYNDEILKLTSFIRNANYEKIIISKIGSGLANRYSIFEKVIEPNIKNDLACFNNIVYLF